MKLRIVCKSPPPPQAFEGFPGISLFASHADTSVFLVAADGSETNISREIESVTWWTNGAEPTRAMVTFVGALLEADGLPLEGDEAQLEIARLRARVDELAAELEAKS